jgi:hypothetical protein
MTSVTVIPTPSMTTPAIRLEDHERQPCEIWTRVMGYHRPVASFNPGKQAEFHERLFFTESRAAPHLAADA